MAVRSVAFEDSALHSAEYRCHQYPVHSESITVAVTASSSVPIALSCCSDSVLSLLTHTAVSKNKPEQLGFSACNLLPRGTASRAASNWRAAWRWSRDYWHSYLKPIYRRSQRSFRERFTSTVTCRLTGAPNCNRTSITCLTLHFTALDFSVTKYVRSLQCALADFSAPLL